MSIFKTRPATTAQPSKIRELTVADLQSVSGGLNPQPLPPRYLSGFRIVQIAQFRGF